MRSLKFTGERILPELGNQFFLVHLSLYRYARSHLHPQAKVLDLGSGEGYGSFLLSGGAKEVIGADVDEEAVEWAQSKYRRSNLNYLRLKGEGLPFEADSFDIVTCFEVVEHVQNDTFLISEINRVLKAGGALFISTPNQRSFGHNLPDIYHVREYELNDFTSLISNLFEVQETLGYTIAGAFRRHLNFAAARFFMLNPWLIRPLTWMLNLRRALFHEKYKSLAYFENLPLHTVTLSKDDLLCKDGFMILARKLAC